MRRSPFLLLIFSLSCMVSLARPALAESGEAETDDDDREDAGSDDEAEEADSSTRNRPATQQGIEAKVPEGFEFGAFQRSHARRLRLQGGALIGFGSALLIVNIPGSFALGGLFVVAGADGPFDDDGLAIALGPLIASQFGAHIAFAALASIIRGVMEFRIATNMKRLFTDSRRQRRRLLAGFVPGPPGAGSPGPGRPWGFAH